MRRLLVALLLVAVLAGALWLVRQREARTARLERAQARLLAFDDRAVEGLELEVAGRGLWRFERQDEGWRVVAPVQDLAADGAISSLLFALRAVPVTRVIEVPESLGEYGLDPPQVRLRLQGVAVPPLDLGMRTPTGDGLFARDPRRKGVLVLGDLGGAGAHLLGPFPESLRERRLLDVPVTQIDALEIEPASGPVTLERRADGWWLTRPHALPASERVVGEVLQILARAEVVAFEDEAGAEAAADAGVRVRVKAAGRAREFVCAARPDGSFAVRTPHRQPLLVVALGADPRSWEAAIFGPETLWRVNRYAVQEVRYAWGARHFAARRENDRWRSADGRELEEQEVYTLLARLFDLPVRGWEVGSREGALRGSLWFRLEDGGEGRALLFEGGRAARDDVPGIVFHLGATPPPPP